MRKQIIAEKAGKSPGPFSHAISCSGALLFVSGQGPVNPATGVAPEGFKEAAEQTLANVQTIVEAAGATMRDVVKVNAYLRDMANFPTFNEVYKQFFVEPYPARTTVQSDLTIPIEIDVIAVLPE
ncbi:MAG TPA: RidA family protein [Chloroflexi bacterium]|jgi:2-iminobutanoate/2-iminopropanoate deaminase|nr:RidA family protein [Chloroflexota bacterium]